MSGKLSRMIAQRRMAMQVGVIGLGAMGGPMAENPQRAGTLHRVWNRSPDRLAAFIARTGASDAVGLAALARDCDLVLCCVSGDADVLEVIDTIAPHLAIGSAVVDTSTVSADTARTAAKKLAAHGVAFLDAPVSGGVEGARQGTVATRPYWIGCVQHSTPLPSELFIWAQSAAARQPKQSIRS
jgi:3-hydroxyisobutyrate dehydrogenase